jgi:hypothetical protein
MSSPRAPNSADLSESEGAIGASDSDKSGAHWEVGETLADRSAHTRATPDTFMGTPCAEWRTIGRPVAPLESRVGDMRMRHAAQ